MKHYNNRKRTRSRRIQVIPEGKQIFHETPAALERKKNYVKYRYGIQL